MHKITVRINLTNSNYIIVKVPSITADVQRTIYTYNDLVLSDKGKGMYILYYNSHGMIDKMCVDDVINIEEAA